MPAATVLVPSTVVPLRNCTVPAAPAPLTVAVSVLAAGATAVTAVGDMARTVVVVTATGAPATVML